MATKIEVMVDERAFTLLLETNQHLNDLMGQESPLTPSQVRQLRSYSQDFIDETRQALGLTTEPRR